MKKFRGKALAALLSLALVASSFPVTFASASTKHAAGVLTEDPDENEFWMVNGGNSKDDRSVPNFQNFVYKGGNAPLETADHQDVDDPEVYSISHVSGDKLVSWDIGDDKDDSSDKGVVKLSLRKSDSKGTEVIAVLYKGTYTDDDDNDVDVTASTQVTIHAVDEKSTVIGDASEANGDYYIPDDGAGTDSPELNGDDDDDDNFALKTTNGKGDSKQIAVYKAERANDKNNLNESSDGCFAVWKMLPTVSENDIPKGQSESDYIKTNKNYAYVLESSNNKDLTVGNGAAAGDVNATVKNVLGTPVTVTVDHDDAANSDVTIDNPTASSIYFKVDGAATAKEITAGSHAAVAYEKGVTKNNDKIADGQKIVVYSDKDASKEIGTYTYSAGTTYPTVAPTAGATNSLTVTVKHDDANSKVVVTNNTSADVYVANVDTVDTTAMSAANGHATIAAGGTHDFADTDLASKGIILADSTATTQASAADTSYTYALDGGNTKTAAKVTAVYPLDASVDASVNSSVTISNKTGATVYYAIGANGTRTSIADGSHAVITYDKITDDIFVYDGTGTDAKVLGQFTYDAGKSEGTADDYVTAAVSEGAGTANLTFKAKVTNAYKNMVKDDDDIKAKVKIEKKVLVNDDSTTYGIFKDGDNHDTVITGDVGSTFKGDEKDASEQLGINGGYIVKFNNANANVTVRDDASVDTIKGTVKKLTVNDAKKVSTIDLKAGNVEIEDSDVKVGDITSKKNAEISVDADNNVGTIKVKDDDGTSTVTMSAGSAKAITTKGSVTLSGSEDDTPISVGTVTSKSVELDSKDGAVSVDNIVTDAVSSDENGCEISLKGDNTNVKSIDFKGFGVDMKFDDFQGTVPAPQNAKADDATFETSDEDDDVTVTGDMDVNTITLEDDSKVVFSGKLSVNDLDGSGTMYIGADKLYVRDSASGPIVKITDNSIKAGDKIFSAASDAVDDNDLDFYGFTVKCNEGKTTDSFVVDQLKFAGLAMNKISDKIVLNDSATYTASAYAPGTSLPTGYSIKFDIDNNSGVFTLTDNGNGTATVKCVDFDNTFSDENKATLQAYVVDASGDEDDDYGMAECNLTALKTPEKTFTSDTNNDFTLAHGASYQFKITDATAAPVMTAGTAGIVDIANVGKSGNDYFIKVTAKGATGVKTGIYVNGTKLLVLTVGGAAAFTCDTTKDVTVKKGASYQYKVTSSVAPTFTIGSANVFHYTLVSHSGNNYFYKITAVGAVGAATGVYVNGTRVNVAKVG